MDNLKKVAEKYNYEPVKLWVGPFLFVGVYKPEDVQVDRFMIADDNLQYVTIKG